ncbi:hypothetical protein BCU85_09270 [Vibrio lentus]|nr:hypothetical protein BCU85_09270 [Vibrio lentus]PMK94788.1 hypothetical protein BCT88_00510 [Vibrio lentus]PML24530.1 hypothetical protein BCT80_22240 [Vibrio lentus]PMM21755.1 hypothetical protein BCT57_11855 [Vibrio lentus]PMM46395.1 hypothetical protein BCT53_05450 [Vibrio lentus]
MKALLSDNKFASVLNQCYLLGIEPPTIYPRQYRGEKILEALKLAVASRSPEDIQNAQKLFEK